MGVIVIDAGVVIGWLSPEDPHHESSAAALHGAVRARAEVVLPASAFAEALVGGWRSGPKEVEQLRHAVRRLPMTVEPVTADIADLAARVRAAGPRAMKLPDALVVATAVSVGAERLITTHRGWGDLGAAGFAGQVEVV